MTNPGPSIASALNNSSVATANFLASLSSSLGAGGGLSGLFESLLESVQTSAAPQAADATAANITSSSPVNAITSPSGGISDLITALQNFATKWNSYQSSGHSQSTTSSNAASSSGATSTTSAATTTQTTAATSGSGAPVSTAGSGTTNAANDPTTSESDAPPSFAELLAQLQSILHMLQKQIQAAEAAGSSGGSTDSTTGNTVSPQDLLAAGGALSDLLALAQSLEKKLGGSSAEGDPSSADANSNAATPDLASLDMQLRANLKTLLGKLQTAASTDANAANDVSASADAGVTVTGFTLAATPTAASGAATTPDVIIRDALATADDFLKQLNSLYTTPASASTLATTITADAVAPAGGGGDASLDADPNGGNANTANTASVATQNLDTAAIPADGTKSANPYSFASQLSATRAQNGGTIGLPSVVEQVLLQLNRNAANGNDQMSIQLHPADLGSINVKLDVGSDGTVSGTVIASNADTLAMLQKDSRSLERALQEAGLRADPGSLQFSLGGQQQNNPGQTAQNQAGGNAASNTTTNALAALTPDIGDTTTDSWVLTPGRVNIQV